MTEDDAKGDLFLKNILSTFKDAGFDILVEGVETMSQSETVQNDGADYIQGFLFSRAIPEKECIELFKKQKQSE